MKVFSTKSRKVSFITLCATCLASFLCAAIILLANSGLFAIAQGNTLNLTIDYVSGQTLSEIDLGTGYEGYAFEDGTALVPVGTNTYTLTKADAEDVTLTLTVNAPLTNVEDVMDSVSVNDFSCTVSGQSSLSTTSRARYVYSDGYAEGTYGANFWSINTTTRTASTNYVNENSYDGNLSLYATLADATTIGYSIKKTDMYGVVKFRTTLSSNYTYSFNMMRDDARYGYADKKGGYGINFNRGSNATGTYFITQYYKVETVDTTATKIKDWGSNWYVSGEVDAYVSYGVYPVVRNGAIANAIVLKVETIGNDGSLTTVVNETVYDTNPNTVVAGGSVFTIDAKWKSGDKKSFKLEGINRPLFAEEDFTVADTYEEGTALKDIPLPAGVDAWKNPEQIITLGDNTFTGVVNSEYYGASSYDVNVAVKGGEKVFATSLNLDFVSEMKVSDLSSKLASGFAFASADLNKELAVGANEFTGTYTDAVLGVKNATITVNVSEPQAVLIENLIDKESDADVYIDGSKITGYTSGQSANVVITKSVEDELNANTHNGNISIYDGTVPIAGSTGLVLNNSAKYGLVQARITLVNENHYVFGMLRSTADKDFKYSNINGGGYYGYLQHNGTRFVCSLFKVGTDGTAVSLGQYFHEFSATDGTDLLVTYGVYPTIVDGEVVNTVVFKGTGTGISFTRTKTDSGVKIVDGDVKFTIAQHYRTAQKSTAYSIEGVNEPLFGISGNFDKVVEDATYPENQALSNITAPEGYEWTESASTTMLNFDQKQYDAYYLYNYYGTTHKAPAKVTLSLSPVNRTLLTLKYGETEYVSYALAYGGEQAISLTAQQIAELDGQLIGWIADNEPNKLYKPEDTYVANVQGETTEVVLNAVVLDFKLIEGAAFKVSEGGLRFFVAFDTEDWAIVKPFVDSAKGVIVPFDSATYYDNGFTEYSITEKAGSDFKDKNAYLGSQIGLGNDYEGYSIYTFSIDQIMYQNYNRLFAGMAFINVKYHDQTVVRFETAFDSEKNTRSIYELASLSGSVLGHKYIANTVELALDNGVIRYENFFTNDVERTYGTEIVDYEVDGSVITVKLSVKAGSLLAQEQFGCVYFKDMADTSAEPVRYKAEILSCVDGVATIQFDIA